MGLTVTIDGKGTHIDERLRFHRVEEERQIGSSVSVIKSLTKSSNANDYNEMADQQYAYLNTHEYPSTQISVPKLQSNTQKQSEYATSVSAPRDKIMQMMGQTRNEQRQSLNTSIDKSLVSNNNNNNKGFTFVGFYRRQDLPSLTGMRYHQVIAANRTGPVYSAHWMQNGNGKHVAGVRKALGQVDKMQIVQDRFVTFQHANPRCSEGGCGNDATMSTHCGKPKLSLTTRKAKKLLMSVESPIPGH